MLRSCSFTDSISSVSAVAGVSGLAATVEVYLEGPVAKKLRRATECALMMVPEDTEVLRNFPHPDADTQVVCLSQTVRTIGDVEVGDRVAVVAPSIVQPIPWHEWHLQDKFTTMWARKELYCEAFKILEADFTELLQSYLGMKMYSDTLEKLRAVIMYTAKSQKHPMDTPLLATFGILAAALVNLLDVEARNYTEKQELAKRMALGKALFMDIVQEGINTLKEKCATEALGTDEQIEEAFNFMCREDNFEDTIREWAAAETRAARNALSHPFTALFSHKDRQIAINYFGTLVNGEYCKPFKNVAILGKLQLQLVDIKESTNWGSKKAGLITELL